MFLIILFFVKYVPFYFYQQFTNPFTCISFFFFLRQVLSKTLFYHSHHPLLQMKKQKIEGFTKLTLMLCFSHYVILRLVQQLSLNQDHTGCLVITYPVNGYDKKKIPFITSLIFYKTLNLLLMLITMKSNILIINSSLLRSSSGAVVNESD